MLQPASLQPHKEVKITFCSEPGAPPPSDMRQSDPGKYNSASGKAGGNHSDKVRTLTADLLMLAAGNSRQMGRRVNVCPDALLDDGLLDFTLMTGSDFRAEVGGRSPGCGTRRVSTWPLWMCVDVSGVQYCGMLYGRGHADAREASSRTQSFLKSMLVFNRKHSACIMLTSS